MVVRERGIASGSGEQTRRRDTRQPSLQTIRDGGIILVRFTEPSEVVTRDHQTIPDIGLSS